MHKVCLSSSSLAHCSYNTPEISLGNLPSGTVRQDKNAVIFIKSPLWEIKVKRMLAWLAHVPDTNEYVLYALPNVECTSKRFGEKVHSALWTQEGMQRFVEVGVFLNSRNGVALRDRLCRVDTFPTESALCQALANCVYGSSLQVNECLKALEFRQISTFGRAGIPAPSPFLLDRLSKMYGENF